MRTHGRAALATATLPGLITVLGTCDSSASGGDLLFTSTDGGATFGRRCASARWA
jgi:hypothetical protein